MTAPESAEIDAQIAGLGDWRGETLAHLRSVILAADPDIVEEIKWRKPSNPDGVPVWSLDGILCTGEVYKDKVKLTFPKGASLPDPSNLFNSSLGGKTRRAIDFSPTDSPDTIDTQALTTLITAAISSNR